MNETIQLQALRLDWNGDFDDDYARTSSYVKGLIGKPWWISKKQLLDCEGPLSKMVEVCLVYQFEADSRIDGYAAYTKYLTKEYGTTQARNRKWSDETRHNIVSPVMVSPFEDLTSSEQTLGEIPDWITEEQRDFLTMWTKMGMEEAAAILGVPVDRAWEMRRNITAKVRYWARKG